ncbi:MAG: hypothetical protein ACRC78_18315 [Planktothrix sp.]
MILVDFNPDKSKGIYPSHRKESKFSGSYSLIVQNNETKELRESAVARLYWTENRCYCCFWLWSSEHSVSVSGSAWSGGYGYDKESQCISDAMYRAGFSFAYDESTDNLGFGGRGSSAIEEAFALIADRFGYDVYYIHRAYA